MITENIVCMIVGILIGYAAMYAADYKPTRIKELVRNYDYKRRNRSLHKEHRQTEHALWMTRAMRAGAEANRCSVCKSHARRVCSNNIKDYFELKYKKWCWVERKCQQKARSFE